MKNLEHLPKKFAFKLDEIGKRWIKETLKTDYDNALLPYFNFDQEKGLNWEHLTQYVRQNHTIISTDQLFPQTQIPTIEKGVMMLVWSEDEDLSVEREVVFFDGNYYYTKHPIKTQPLVCWRHAKPIPKIPEFTIEEAEQKFNIKIKQ